MRRTITLEEFWKEGGDRFGDNIRNWHFVCPACGTRQSIDTLLAAGIPHNDVEKYIAFSCVGRFTGQGDAGIVAKNKGQQWDKGCNWTLGGLLTIHRLEVVYPDGTTRPAFDFAPADS